MYMRLGFLFLIFIFLSLISIDFCYSEDFRSDFVPTNLSGREKIYYEKGLSFKKQGKWNEAISEFTMVLKLNQRSAESHYNIGLIYEYKLMYEDAIRFFLKASDINSKYAFYAGLDQENLGRLEDAITSFRKVLANYPESIDSRFHLALSYKRKMIFPEAISEFKKILEQDQKYAGAYYNLSLIYKNLGLIKESQKEAEKFNQLTFSNWKP